VPDPHAYDHADALTFLLLRQHGVVSRAQALGHLTPAALRHRVASGRWQRVHRRVYVGRTGPITHAQRPWIAVLGSGGVLAGLAALEFDGFRGYPAVVTDVLLPAGRHHVDPPPGVRIRRTVHLDADDVIRAGLPRTGAARSLVDAAQWAATDDQACAIVAAGFQQRLVGAGDVEKVVERLRHVRRGALITRTAADAAGGSHSLAELDYLRLSRRAGLPEPSRQHVRQDCAGRRRYLDVWYDEYGVQVEIDGGQHFEARAAWADMRRQNDLWITGVRVLRFPAWLLRARPAEVMAQVEAALTAAGWPGCPTQRS
jgi:very-short-patch-repair endonuclease